MNIHSPYLGKEDMKDIRNIAKQEPFRDKRKIYKFKVIKYDKKYHHVTVSFYTKYKNFHKEVYGIYGNCWRFLHSIKGGDKA
jgi:hypothetical protein